MSHNDDLLDIVLPCYNPQEDFIDTLAPMVAELRASYPEKRIRLIVVNDGSVRNFSDKEKNLLLDTVPDTEIIDQIPNRGKGAAVRKGIAASQAEHTVYTDFDMPYSLETMREVIDKVCGGYDLVIAIRNKSYYSKLSPMRKLMSYGSKTLNRLFLRTKFTDTQGGLKGMSSRAKRIMLNTKIDDFLFDTEFVVKASRNKSVRITEVESTLRNDVILSKMSSKILFRELRNFFRIAFVK